METMQTGEVEILERRTRHGNEANGGVSWKLQTYFSNGETKVNLKIKTLQRICLLKQNFNLK
jgi:hypothetical protein